MTASARPSISVVVPVYNSEESLPALVARLEPVMRRIASKFELVLVNDCSRDNSWNVVEQLAREHAWIRGVDLMRNFGQHNALLCGIREARHELVATIDDDLQNPPEEIPRLLAAMRRTGADVVYGTPKRERHGLLRDAASLVTKLVLQKAMGAETARMVSAFRVFRTDVREAFGQCDSMYVSIDVLLTWGTNRFAAVRVRHDPRATGVSNYTVSKLASHALNMTTGFSTWPLRLASLLGFGFTGFGALVFVYVTGRYIVQGTPVAGFPFLASTIAIFAGAQLFALGVMGEYLARIHVRAMRRPAYVERRRTGAETERK